jgi:hypothetical protein
MTRKPHGAARAATRTNVRQHNSQNVCSYLLNTSAVVLLYAEDAGAASLTIRGDRRKCADCKAADGGGQAESAIIRAATDEGEAVRAAGPRRWRQSDAQATRRERIGIVRCTPAKR